MKILFANGINLAVQHRDPYFFDSTGFLGFADADLVARWAADSMHPEIGFPADYSWVEKCPPPVYWSNIREKGKFVFADRNGETYRFLKEDWQGRATANHRCFDADYYGAHPSPVDNSSSTVTQ